MENWIQYEEIPSWKQNMAYKEHNNNTITAV